MPDHTSYVDIRISISFMHENRGEGLFPGEGKESLGQERVMARMPKGLALSSRSGWCHAPYLPCLRCPFDPVGRLIVRSRKKGHPYTLDCSGPCSAEEGREGRCRETSLLLCDAATAELLRPRQIRIRMRSESVNLMDQFEVRCAVKNNDNAPTGESQGNVSDRERRTCALRNANRAHPGFELVIITRSRPPCP
jgi:hypothetical protein